MQTLNIESAKYAPRRIALAAGGGRLGGMSHACHWRTTATRIVWSLGLNAAPTTGGSLSLGRLIVALSLAGLMLFAVAGCGSNGPTTHFTGRWRPEGSKGGEFVVVKRSADGSYTMAFLNGRTASVWLPMKRLGRALYLHIAAVKPDSGPRIPGYDFVLTYRPADGRLLYGDNVLRDYELTKASDNTSLPEPQPSASE